MINVLNIQLIEGPFRGRWVSIDEPTARRGRICIPEEGNLRHDDPDVVFSNKVHRYRTLWHQKLGWVALYEGEE
jgi:hypothetical protein